MSKIYRNQSEKRRLLSFAVTAIVAGSFLSACGGSGKGLDENGRPVNESTSPSGTNTNTSTEATAKSAFNEIQKDILTPDCATSGCHSGTTSPLGLNLDEGKAYANLVNKASNQVSGLMLVEPSNPDASYLIHKLEGTQSGGTQMPLAKPPLSSADIAKIRSWILDGAAPPLNAPASGSNSPDTAGPVNPPNSGEPVSPPDSGEPDNSNVLVATLSSIQKNVFDTTCSGCHSGDSPLGALSLADGQSYTQLVERAATEDPQKRSLVAIGDAGNSFLIKKLVGDELGKEGEPNYGGARMPITGNYLDDATVKVIEEWINAGAKDN